MNQKNPNAIAHSAEAVIGDAAAAGPVNLEPLAPSPKRGFKPRWLRLQRRERKLREARAMAVRPIVG
jgi:hypothetical protein